jgi:RND family efflux transporter MFP subunit
MKTLVKALLPSLLLAPMLYSTHVPAQAPASPVELANVHAREIASTVRVTGTVLSREDVELASELEGRLSWVAEVGDRVASGEAVAVVDDHLLQLDLRNDEAEIARLEADLGWQARQIARLSKLAVENNTAKSELDELKSRREMLKQELRIAEIDRDRTLYDLERTKVLAPFDGIVATRMMDSGEYTQAGSGLVRLVNTRAVEVSAQAPLRVARYSRSGESVLVSSDVASQLTPIRSLIPVGDGRSHMMEVRIRLSGSNWLIGEAVTVELPDSAREEQLTVPRDALVLRDKLVYLFTVDAEGVAHRVPVSPGTGLGENIAVTGTLSAGDRVVVRGAERLRDGQSVRVLDSGVASR